MPNYPQYDLTLQYISQSYMRLLQTPDGTTVLDGSGSSVAVFGNFVQNSQTSSMYIPTASYAATSSYYLNDIATNAVGTVSQATITDNGNGSVNAGSVDCYLYPESGWIGSLRRYTVPASSNLLLVNNSINYLIINYNSGSPSYSMTTNSVAINNSNVVIATTLYREDNEIHSISVNWGLATATRENNRSINIERYVRISGLVLGESVGNIITISSGTFYYGITAFAKTAVSSSANHANLYYQSASTWIKTSASSYNSTQYNGVGGLSELSTSSYAVNWVYRYSNGSSSPQIAYVLGSGDYSLAQAKESTVPVIPLVLQRMAILVGRIIVGKNGTTAEEINSAFSTVFAGTSITNHNTLTNLQGGTTDEYYHLTNDTYGRLNNNSFAMTGSNAFDGNQVITGSLNVSVGITGSLYGTASNAISSSYAPIQYNSPFIKVSSSYSASMTDQIIVCSGSFNVSLPIMTGSTGKHLTIKCSSGYINVYGASTNTIDDVSPQFLISPNAMTVIADGVNSWFII